MGAIQISEISLNDQEIDAALAVLKSALRQGKQCEAFEQEFAAAVGSKFAITCANGSAALHLAYAAILQPGDEVLVPSFTFFATGSMAVHAGGIPVFCDVDPETCLINLADAEHRITSSTRAIAPVHLYGNPCDTVAVEKFAAKHNLEIVWDAAQAHGARHNGRDVGSYDRFVTYSFYPSKNMFVGEGGMICTNDPEMDYQLKYLRAHGQTAKYYHTMLGFNYRMSDVEAAIGRGQLQRLPHMLEVRRRNAEILSAGLSKVPGIRLPKLTPGGVHAWHQFCIFVDPSEFGCTRDELADRLQKRYDIATAIPYPRGLHQQPIFEQRFGTSHLPVTETLAQTVLALPVHHGLSAASAARIVDGVIACR